MPAHIITPPLLWATRSTTLTSANRSPTWRLTRCLPSASYSENRDSSMKRTPLQSARHHQMWVFSHSRWLRQRSTFRTRPRWGRQACRWASLRRFLTVCAEILWLCKPIVTAAGSDSDGSVRIWRKEHESMDPSCLVSTVQAGGRGVMVWGIFSWHTLGPLVPIEYHLNATAYLSIVADHVHPFMTTVFPSSG